MNERNKVFNSGSLESTVEKSIWSIPVTEDTLRKLGYKNTMVHKYSEIYKEYITYFRKEDRKCGFIRQSNPLMFPTRTTYKQVTEEEYEPRQET